MKNIDEILLSLEIAMDEAVDVTELSLDSLKTLIAAKDIALKENTKIQISL